MAKTDVAKAESKAGAVIEAGAADFEEFAGAGMENVGADDLLVPRLTILQALSPQINKRKSEYIEGAEVGMIADVGTGELFPDGVIFLPVLYRKEYLEWAPRESNKGLVEIHPGPEILDKTSLDDKRRPVLPNGNYIAETAQFYGLNLSSERQMSFIPMTSTQLKKARRWNTLALREKLKRADGSEFTPPLWYRSYILGTAEEDNAQGEWFGWTINRGAALPEMTRDDFGFDWRTVKEEAIAFQKSLEKGEARADTSDLQGDATAGGAAGGGSANDEGAM